MSSTLPRRLAVWIWKEWRDRRAVLLGIALAVPVLTAIAFFAFPERMAVAARGSNHVAIDAEFATFSRIFHVLALAMVVLAVAADLFSSDLRSGSIALTRRLPRGLGLAFVAKLAFFALVSAAVLLWQTGCLAAAWGAVGLERPLGRSWEALFLAPSGLWLPAAALVAAAWIAMTSLWLPSSGAAVGAGPLLLVLVLVPGAFLLQDHLYLARGLLPLLPEALLGLLVVAVVAAGVSYLRGHRFQRGPWAAAWRGLAVVAISLTGAYGLGARQLEAFLDFAPGGEDVWIWNAIPGEGGRLLYLNAHRGAAPWDSRARDLQTPPRAFVLDIATGRVVPLDEPGTWVDRVPGASCGPLRGGPHALEPAPVLVSRRLRDDEEVTSCAWVDGATGTIRKVLPVDFGSPEVVAWTREGLRAATRVRDAEGRPCWLRIADRQGRRVFERDGAPAPDRPPARDLHGFAAWAIPGGWFEPGGKQGWGILDAAGAYHRLPGSTGWPEWLSAETCLLFITEPSQAGPRGTWRLRDAATGREEPVADPPAAVLHAVGRGLALVLREDDGARRLALWNPVTGEDVALSWVGPALDGIDAGAGVGGRADRDLHLLGLRRKDGVTSAYAVLDPAARTLRRVSGWARPEHVLEPAALTDDGALLALEDSRRVVRLQEDRREVVFPREEPGR